MLKYTHTHTSITLPKLTGSSELKFIIDPKADITAITYLNLDYG